MKKVIAKFRHDFLFLYKIAFDRRVPFQAKLEIRQKLVNMWDVGKELFPTSKLGISYSTIRKIEDNL